MKAVIDHEHEDFRIEHVDDPALQVGTDAVVRVLKKGPQEYIPRLLPLIEQGRLGPSEIVTHCLPILSGLYPGANSIGAGLPRVPTIRPAIRPATIAGIAGRLPFTGSSRPSRTTFATRLPGAREFLARG